MPRESDIMYEHAPYWVQRMRKSYDVLMDGFTHARVMASFPKTDDGLSLAKAYADYNRKRQA